MDIFWATLDVNRSNRFNYLRPANNFAYYLLHQITFKIISNFNDALSCMAMYRD